MTSRSVGCAAQSGFATLNSWIVTAGSGRRRNSRGPEIVHRTTDGLAQTGFDLRSQDRLVAGGQIGVGATNGGSSGDGSDEQ